MKSLLLRFYNWLGRILGQDTKYDRGDSRRPTAGQPDLTGRPSTPPSSETPAADLSGLAPPVTLPSPLPPQMDIHAGEQAKFGRKASVVTQPEGRLYRSLLLAAADEYTVLSKVRLWDFIWLVNEPPERKQHLSRLSCRHVDFLLCEPLTLKPLLVIELDDGTHKTSFAEGNDLYKDQLFAAAGLPILRLNHPNYPPRQLRDKIEEELRIRN